MSSAKKPPAQDPVFRAKIKAWFERLKNANSANVIGIADELKQSVGWHKNESNNLLAVKLQVHLSHASLKDLNLEAKFELYKVTKELIKFLPDKFVKYNFLVGVYYISLMLSKVKQFKETIELIEYMHKANDEDEPEKYSVLLQRSADNINPKFKELLATTFLHQNPKAFAELQSICSLRAKLWRKTNITANLFTDFQNVTNDLYKLDSRHKSKITATFLTDTVISEFPKPILFANAKKDQIIIACENFVLVLTQIALNNSVGKQPEVLRALELIWKSIQEAFATDLCGAKMVQKWKKLFLILAKPLDKLVEEDTLQVLNLAKVCKPLPKFNPLDHAVQRTFEFIDLMLQKILCEWAAESSSAQQRYITVELLENILHLLNSTTGYVPGYCNQCRRSCPLTSNVYTMSTLVVRIFTFAEKLPVTTHSQSFRALMRSTSKKLLDDLTRQRKSGCQSWQNTWGHLGTHFFNASIRWQNNYYADSEDMAVQLLKGITKNGAFSVNNTSGSLSHFNLTIVLHRLSKIHIANNDYKQAMLPAVVGILLDMKDGSCKEFDLWMSIQQQAMVQCSGKVITMVDYLNDVAVNGSLSCQGVKVQYTEEELPNLCLMEIMALCSSKRNLTRCIKEILAKIKASKYYSDAIYCQGIVWLAYYTSHFSGSEPITRYLEEAEKLMEKSANKFVMSPFTDANLKYFKLINTLTENKAKNEAELKAIPQVVEDEEKNKTYIIPILHAINMTENKKRWKEVTKVVEAYTNAFAKHGQLLTKGAEANLILDNVLGLAELCRLHYYRTNEQKAWKVAWKLASHLDDNGVKVYIAARFVDVNSPRMNEENVKQMLIYIDAKKNPDPRLKEAISRFLISLSQRYLQQDKKEAFIDSFKRLCASFENDTLKRNMTTDASLFLSKLALQIKGYHKLRDEGIEENSMLHYFTVTMYSLLHIHYSENWDNGTKMIDKKRYAMFDAWSNLMNVTSELVYRMNSWLSYREIDTHIMLRLKMSQCSGWYLRTAECLKNLCLLDLSRNQVTSCESNLLELERVLDMQGIKESMKGKSAKCSQAVPSLTSLLADSRPISPYRDCSFLTNAQPANQRYTSPVLQHKVFVMPEFLEHKKQCDCLRCENSMYKYLVFACTYIRAQLYVEMGEAEHALDHFFGGIKILGKIADQEGNIRESAIYTNEVVKVDVVSFLVDYCRMLKRSSATYNSAYVVLNYILNVCKQLKLEKHPIYFHVLEFVSDYHFEHMCKQQDNWFDFEVPNPSDLDIDEFIKLDKFEPAMCSTPNVGELKAAKVATKKPTFKLNANPAAKNLFTEVPNNDVAKRTTKAKPKAKPKEKKKSPDQSPPLFDEEPEETSTPVLQEEEELAIGVSKMSLRSRAKVKNPLYSGRKHSDNDRPQLAGVRKKLNDELSDTALSERRSRRKTKRGTISDVVDVIFISDSESETASETEEESVIVLDNTIH